MLTTLVIVLVIGIVGMGIFIILSWKRISGTSKIEIPDRETGKRQTTQHRIPETTISQNVIPQPQAPIQPPKSKFPKPNIQPDARIETITAIYSDMPGILGTLIADRFGQTIAADTSLVLDRIAVPAYFMEILNLARHERLPMGKPKSMFICSEGSYWIFGEIAGMPWGIWFEHEINMQDALGMADDFRSNLIKIFKTNYTRIW